MAVKRDSDGVALMVGRMVFDWAGNWVGLKAT